MTFEIRPAKIQEMDQFGLMGAYSYAGAFGDGADNVVRNSNRPEWTLCAFDGETMATSYAAFPFTIRANGASMAYAGITAVGTRPEYRRKGLLRSIMTQAFEEQRARGQAVAGLWASQAAIYQRYGFSMLGANRRYAVDTVDLTFHDGKQSDLTVRRFANTEALTTMKTLYRDYIAQRFGYLHRSQTMWIETVLTEDQASGPVWTVIVYDAAEQPCGYAAYTLRSDKVDHSARGQEIVIRDLVWLNPDAYRALWSFVARHDLVGRVVWDNAPLDDPLLDLLSEPRMLHHRDHEASWFRLVDVPQALSQRGYQGSGSVVLEITEDSLAPWNAGKWHLQVEDSVATVAATKAPATAQLSVKTLGSMFTGTRRASDLNHWGLLQTDVESLATLDAIFATTHAAHLPDHY
jgi:predicted acetyltransferase